ncbi:zinc-binding dehydrogenase [Streptomyces scopuliridis]|uniref:Zinc-binding dehydrogenase n=1 Tax=Streptomyces scopuliridis TaxID=452529 RepID=A0ACD4ZM08_9ACTN|nr:zinc-binding dehydrogenase [Streptomyces scopuliridis]WSB99342.1 zinc-binding dehydrogenase [Streptomyces scopuliridis]WSC06957.1 zinc-binding dehydrogenase [Streptomyces scopuliridis]
MRAARVTAFGGPEVLVTAEAPDPVAGPREVVIAVAVVDTIFVQTQVRAGWGQEYFPVRPPYILGGGVAGTVRSVGDGVDAGWTGRRVVASIGITGGSAELVATSVESLVPVPDELPFTTAAAVFQDGVTALALMDLTGVTAGERVLITGASGGMGTLMVQLAKARGAYVVGVARGARKTALVRELGADAVVDGAHDDWPARAREALGATGADVVLDGVGGETGLAAFPLTADGGRFSAHGAPTGGFAPVDAREAADRRIRLLGIADVQIPQRETVRLAAQALTDTAAGRLRPVIGGTFPLDRAADAHRAIEGRGLLGKVLLTT